MTNEAQTQQDEELAKRSPPDKKFAEDLIQSKGASSLPRAQSQDYDPIDGILARNPKLSRERAEEMAKKFGF